MTTPVLSYATKKYERDGYVILRKVVDVETVCEARRHVQWLQNKNPGVIPEELNYRLVTNDAFWVRLISDSRLLNYAEQFIGPDLGVFSSHYMAKPPSSGKAVLWHQDGSYWPLEPMEAISFWVALDRSDEENGCMRVIPGSQNNTVTPESDLVKLKGDYLWNNGMDPDWIDESKAVSLILNPGDVSIHHPSIVHSSTANRSTRWRRGLTIRYISTSTRITANHPHSSAFILRGRGYANGNGWNPWPAYNPETSMVFSGLTEWNRKCAVKNDKYAEFIKRNDQSGDQLH